jgi:hypothetical protein
VEQTQPHRVFDAIVRAAEMMGQLLEADEDDVFSLGEHRDELASLLPLLGLERFDRRGLNGPVLPNVSPAANCTVVPSQQVRERQLQDWSYREPALKFNALTCGDALPCGWGHVREHRAVYAQPFEGGFLSPEPGVDPVSAERAELHGGHLVSR